MLRKESNAVKKKAEECLVHDHDRRSNQLEDNTIKRDGLDESGARTGHKLN